MTPPQGHTTKKTGYNSALRQVFEAHTDSMALFSCLDAVATLPDRHTQTTMQNRPLASHLRHEQQQAYSVFQKCYVSRIRSDARQNTERVESPHNERRRQSLKNADESIPNQSNPLQ